ncbi:hypothetical protein CRU94_07395 [Arcobacter sp. AHV-9/2010]|nr:hypothetical protein CRU94_07395 [Arcobacter sp. CECT 9299]
MLLYKQLKVRLINHKRYLKSSFALIEVLISIVLLTAISLALFKTTSNISNKGYFSTLLEIENSLEKKDFSKFKKSNKTLKVLKNNSFEELNLTLYEYKNSDLKVVFYEK